MTRHSSRLTALALLAACAGQPPATPPTPGNQPAGEAPGIALRENWHATVEVDRDDSIILTLPSGQRQLQRFDRRAIFSLQTDSNGKVAIRLDSMWVRPRTGDEHSPRASWSARVGDTRVNALHVEEGGDSAAELTALVRNMLPRLPRTGLHARSTWADTASGSVRVDVFSANERRTAAWSAGEPAERGGARVVPVRVREDFEQLGDGSQGGRRLTMTSQGRRSGTYYVTSDGRVSSAMLEDSVAMLISIPSTKEVVPTIRYGRTTMRYVSGG